LIGSSKRTHLRSEAQTAIVDLVVDHFDTHGVTRNNQPLVTHIPDGKAKHAIQMVEYIRAPLFVAVNDYFSVGIRSKLMALALKFCSQFPVIVNLAIEDYPHSFFCVRHRLMTASEVDDR